MIDFAGIFNALRTHAESLGVFDAVLTHEPKSAPLDRWTCCITYVNTMPAMRSSGSDVTSAKITLQVRVMRNMLSEPQDSIDPDLCNIVDLLLTAYVGDFTLGGTARAIDIRGMEGEPINAPAGYLPIDSKWFRIVDIRLPIIVNDAWTESP